MKKNNLVLFVGGIVVLLVFAGFFFMSDKNVNTENQSNENRSIDKDLNNVDIVVGNNLTGGVELEINENEGDKKEQTDKEITMEIRNIIKTYDTYIIKHEGEEGEIYKNLQEDYFKNYNKRRDISNIKDYIKGDENIEKQVDIFIFDYKEKKPLEGVDIYIWGLWVGKTNKDGNLNKKITLAKDLSVYYIQAKKRGYIGGFVHVNSFIEEEDDENKINRYIELKKTISKVGDYNNIDIINNDFKITLTGDCNFKTLEGICYNGKVTVDVGYIGPDEVEELGFPLMAIPKTFNGPIIYLTSSGMDFTTFYDNKGNLLTYTKQNKIKICHHISDESRALEKENLDGIIEHDGIITFDDEINYRWFDKTKGIWIADVDAIKTQDGKYQCYETFNP